MKTIKSVYIFALDEMKKNMEIEELEKSSYGYISKINSDLMSKLFYSYAFYKGEPVGIGVWELDTDKCLSAIVSDENGEKIYLNKIDFKDLEMSVTNNELEKLFENFLKKSGL